jgi:hypothetical protein
VVAASAAFASAAFASGFASGFAIAPRRPVHLEDVGGVRRHPVQQIELGVVH